MPLLPPLRCCYRRSAEEASVLEEEMEQRKLYATSARSAFALVIALTATLIVKPLHAQQNTDTVRAGRYDYGKMWTFEYPPSAYFSQTYNFDANAKWFEKARMASLRIPGCSA